MTTPRHLGGHCGITHTDAAVLQLLRGRFEVRTLLDVGCGPGGMAAVARAQGVRWIGIDGDPAVCERPPYPLRWDLTIGPYTAARVDLVWCVEVVEHVEAAYLFNLLTTFRCGRVLFMTHAVPGQEGHHHVNCQPSTYWIEALERDGWRFDDDATLAARQAATDLYTRATGLVFVREDADAV